MKKLPLFVVLSLSASTALAQGYPTKPVRIVVPYAAGGGVDAVARLLASKYGELWKQPVLVENRGGSGGVVGADVVAKSAPDGYTFLYATNAQAIIPSIYRKLPFEVKDLTPVTMVVSSQLVLSASPKLSATNVREFIELARSQPGKLNYGSSGPGGPIHLAMEMLKLAAGIDLVHIPYKGDAQTVPALMSGEIHATFTPMVSALTQIRAGKVRPLAVSGAKRAAALPDVPSIVEAGYKDASIMSWTGFFAPAGSPRDAMNRLAADTQRVLKMPDFVENLARTGQEAEGTTPEAFATYYQQELARYAKVIKEARVPPVD